MAMIDTTRKRSQRIAYEAYVALYRRWSRAALGDPARTDLAEATRRAEVRWRTLMVPASDTVLDQPGGAVVSPSAVPVSARTALADSYVPQMCPRSLSAWG